MPVGRSDVRPNAGECVQTITIVGWLWKAAVAIAWLAVVIGWLPSGSGMNWLVSLEVWLTNNVADPILTALLTGLLVSSLAVPVIWRAIWRLHFRSEATRLKLSQLRSEGVEVRNEAADENYYLDDNAWDDWATRVVAWNDKVVAAIAKVSGADAEWYRTLDHVPPPAVQMTLPPGDDGNGRQNIFSTHCYRLEKLEQLITGAKGNLLIYR